MRMFLKEIASCVRNISKALDWWRRSSVILRVASMVLIMAITLLYLGFVDAELNNITKYANKNYHSKILVNKPKKTISKDKKNNSTNAKVAEDKKSPVKSDDKNDFWMKPTGGEYPNLSGVMANRIHVEVDLFSQKARIYVDNKNVYTMIISSGIANTTPKGSFRINGRGNHFYNSREKLGGDYYVNFWGSKYLFHSVPTRQNFGDYIASESAKLGTPASHGCVRLSVSDAKWFNEHIPDGTSVHIG